MRSLAVVILAAGQGTRMKSDKAKVLHPMLGKPLVYYPLAAARSLGAERIVMVVGNQADQVKEALADQGLVFALQKKQLGTGHAVIAAMPGLRGFSGDVLVLYGDSPLLTSRTLSDLVKLHRRKKAAMSLIIANLENPFGYGRIVRDGKGKVREIVEQKDCSDEEKKITEINPGIYVYKSDFLKKALPALKNDNAQKEYYLTDLLGIAVDGGQKVESIIIEDPAEILGVNSRHELARAAGVLRERINRAHCDAGVTIEDPPSTWIEPEVKLARDATIEPGARLEGKTVVGEGARIEMNCRVSGSVIEPGAIIKTGSVIEESKVGAGAQVGPMAHLRPGSSIGADARIGNYVETKKAVIGKGSKASHLSYIGDAEVGSGVNIGCGFITCNYDGVNKHKTVIEDGVFVGSDSQTVAPVTIGKGAYIGSGSTITGDVEPDSLTLSRSPQISRPGWASKKRAADKKQSKAKKASKALKKAAPKKRGAGKKR